MSIARWAAVRAALLTALLAAALFVVLALNATGATAAVGGVPGVEPPPPGPETAPAGKALLVRGRAIAPIDAPPAIKRVIRAANRIRAKPYVWGGGHGSWEARGYDCSGAVSYALHGGGLLDTPLVSGSMMRWEEPGPGHWITVYANAGHAYAVIAGLRWDTSGNLTGTGPRWHTDTEARAGFAVRHPAGY
jgi:hypothetical protein